MQAIERRKPTLTLIAEDSHVNNIKPNLKSFTEIPLAACVLKKIPRLGKKLTCSKFSDAHLYNPCAVYRYSSF